MMTDFLSSQYDVDTIADIDEASWDLFRKDLRALITYFELSPNFHARPTITDTVMSDAGSVRVPFRGLEVTLCRARGMTAIKSTLESGEDLFVRAMIALYAYHGQGKTAVFASGSNNAWNIAKAVAGQATSRAGVSSTLITVDESRITDAANRDSLAYASIYDVTPTPQTSAAGTRLTHEKRWFF